ncbi:MAG: component of SufBCD complex [Gemmobacter sp.]
MDWYKTVFDTIDMRSFSNLWFWVALAVLWSSASYWVLGVPFDMVTRARRNGGTAAEDLDTMVHINARRMLFIARVSGLWLTGIAAFFFTTLAALGFLYHIEFAQAIFLLLAPMTVVGGLSLRTSARIEATGDRGPDLWRRLTRHRMRVQFVGALAIFVTAMWGMLKNLNVSVL